MRAEPNPVPTATRVELRSAPRAGAACGAASLLAYLTVLFLALMAAHILGALIEPSIGAATIGGTVLLPAIIVPVRACAHASRIARTPWSGQRHRRVNQHPSRLCASGGA